MFEVSVRTSRWGVVWLYPQVPWNTAPAGSLGEIHFRWCQWWLIRPRGKWHGSRAPAMDSRRDGTITNIRSSLGRAGFSQKLVPIHVCHLLPQQSCWPPAWRPPGRPAAEQLPEINLGRCSPCGEVCAWQKSEHSKGFGKRIELALGGCDLAWVAT